MLDSAVPSLTTLKLSLRLQGQKTVQQLECFNICSAEISASAISQPGLYWKLVEQMKKDWGGFQANGNLTPWGWEMRDR